MTKFIRSVIVSLIWAFTIITAADKLADFQARGTREAIQFQRELRDTQLQRLFQHQHEDE